MSHCGLCGEELSTCSRCKQPMLRGEHVHHVEVYPAGVTAAVVTSSRTLSPVRVFHDHQHCQPRTR